MLAELFRTGVQLTQVVGLSCLLWGVFLLMGGLAGGRGPFDLVRGAALVAFGVWVAGLGQGL